MKAFLVDDEPIAIDRLRVLIQEHGRVEVVGAGSDPVAVLPAIRESGPDVLFLDIEMPGLSGFELLEQSFVKTGRRLLKHARYFRFAAGADRVYHQAVGGAQIAV